MGPAVENAKKEIGEGGGRMCVCVGGGVILNKGCMARSLETIPTYKGW